MSAYIFRVYESASDVTMRAQNVMTWPTNLSETGNLPISASTGIPKQNPRGHTTITFRSFKKFDETIFLFDLSLLLFTNVYDHIDPDEALSIWYDTIEPVIDNHAPIQHKRVKATKPCPWLTQKLIREITKRDQLKRNKRFDEYKKQRNYVLNLVEKASSSSSSRLCPSTAGCSPPSMSSIFVCLLLS